MVNACGRRFQTVRFRSTLMKAGLTLKIYSPWSLLYESQSSPADDGSEKPAGPWSELPHSSNPPSYPTDCRDSKSVSGASSPAFGHSLEPSSKACQGGTVNPGQRFCPWGAGFITQQHSFDSELLPRAVMSAPHWEGRQLQAPPSSLRSTVS